MPGCLYCVWGVWRPLVSIKKKIKKNKQKNIMFFLAASKICTKEHLYFIIIQWKISLLEMCSDPCIRHWLESIPSSFNNYQPLIHVCTVYVFKSVYSCTACMFSEIRNQKQFIWPKTFKYSYTVDFYLG